MFFNPEPTDAPKPGSARYPYGDVGAPSATFAIPATAGLPPTSRAATSYLATKLQHLSLPSATPVTARITTLHTRAQPDPYLTMARAFDVRDVCSAVVSDKRRRLDIGSGTGLMFYTATERLPQLAVRPRSSLYHRASRPSDFCKSTVSCRMDTYSLRRDSFIKAKRSASVSSERGPSLQLSVGRERAWLHH